MVLARLCPSVGCARSKLQYHTVPQKSKIISLDAGLRMDGLPALDLWHIVIDALRSTQGIANSNGPQLTGNRGETKDHTQTQTKDYQTR